MHVKYCNNLMATKLLDWTIYYAWWEAPYDMQTAFMVACTKWAMVITDDTGTSYGKLSQINFSSYNEDSVLAKPAEQTNAQNRSATCTSPNQIQMNFQTNQILCSREGFAGLLLLICQLPVGTRGQW